MKTPLDYYEAGKDVKFELSYQGLTEAISFLDKCKPKEASIISCSKSNAIYVTHSSCEMIRVFETLIYHVENGNLIKDSELQLH